MLADPELYTAFGLAPKDAINYFASKGYAVSWNWFDVWQEAHARAFTVAKALRADVLQDIRDEVQKALDEGITFRQFQKELIPRLKANGWWGEVIDEQGNVIKLGSPRRLRTIFRTNIQTSYMAGRYKNQIAVAEQRPYWQYVAVMDSATRPSHSALHGKAYRYDDPFWDTHYPPNGWGCRCRVRTLSERQRMRENIGIESSEGNIVTKQVPIGKPELGKYVTVTGIKTTDRLGQPVTVYTDPGWNYNPGKAAWQPDITRYDKEIRKEL